MIIIKDGVPTNVPNLGAVCHFYFSKMTKKSFLKLLYH